MAITDFRKHVTKSQDPVFDDMLMFLFITVLVSRMFFFTPSRRFISINNVGLPSHIEYVQLLVLFLTLYVLDQ